MPKKIDFWVHGKPIPQERPFVTRHGTFDRKRSKAAKEIIRLRALEFKEDWCPFAGPAGVILHFYGANPAADIDNLTKLVLDAISGVFWKNDRQVESLWCKKIAISKYDDPRTEITVYPVDDKKEAI